MPPPPLNFRELYQHHVINSATMLLAWNSLSSTQLHDNLLDTYFVSVPSLGVGVSTVVPEVSLLIPLAIVEVGVSVSSCNCAGCGNNVTLNLATGKKIAP